jgi:integrase
MDITKGRNKMKKQTDTKNLRLRGNVWWVWYQMPKKLLALPQFEHHPKKYTQSLKTDSLTIAKRLRDKIVFSLNDVPEDTHDAWEKEIVKRAKQFNQYNPNDIGITYQDILVDEILDEAKRTSGVDKVTGIPLEFTETQQIQLDVLANKRPDKYKMLSHITAQVIREEKANGLALKSLSQINRSHTWFLENACQNDVDITTITYDQVRDFITRDLESGKAGNTIKGYVSPLTKIWNRARFSKIVSGENPFKDHKYKKITVSYDPYTYDEVFDMYNHAESETLKLLIHAGATTGARLNELLTAEVRTVSTFDSPCWLFMFNEPGKTEQSTRVVPLHPSLNLPEGFSFNMKSDTRVGEQFKELREKCIKNLYKELSSKPRKLAFHSFRSTVTTHLTDNMMVNEKVVGGITGHLGGGGKAGSIRTYINPTDLKRKLEIVSMIPWNP